MMRALVSFLLLVSTACPLVAGEAAARSRGMILDRNGQPPLAAHVVGYLGHDKGGVRGRSGLEEKFNSTLAKGGNVTTTLDGRIERVAQKVLVDYGRPGGVVVLDAQSGEVLAVESAPSYDPQIFVPAISEQAYAGLRDDPRCPLLERNFGAAWKAGQDLQVFDALSAAKCGKLDAKAFVVCRKEGAADNVDATEQLDLRAALRKANTHYFAQAVAGLTDRQYMESMKEFGFGHRTSLELGGESDGQLRLLLPKSVVDFREKAGLNIASFSVDQGGILFTALQLAQATCALATGGQLPKLRLELHPVPAPEPAKSLHLPAPAVEAVALAMREAVSSPGGMAHAADVEGMAVAGLCYTNSYVRTNGEKKETIRYGTFFGFAPAEKPKFVVVVTVEEGTGAADAAACAGKVFRELK
jgi:penicillin-binding protein 2